MHESTVLPFKFLEFFYILIYDTNNSSVYFISYYQEVV